MQKVLKLAGSALRWIINILLATLLCANVYTIVARQLTGTPQPDIFGWSWAVVVSGSMEPAISLDDLVIVKEQDEYHENDVIAYESGSSVVTHRIVEEGEGYYITKGDANNTKDKPVPHAAVIGKVQATIPYVGLVVAYLKTPIGMFCLVLIGLLMIGIPYFIDTSKKKRGRQ